MSRDTTRAESLATTIAVTIYLPGLRIEGRIWAKLHEPVIEGLEAPGQRFLAVRDATLFRLRDKGETVLARKVPAAAVNKDHILALVPGEAKDPSDFEASEQGGEPTIVVRVRE